MAADFDKDPGDILDYKFNWEQWLSDDEVIISSSWTTSGLGITTENDSFSDTETVVWLAGGSNTAVYSVKNQIQTNQGRTVERTMTIHVIFKSS